MLGLRIADRTRSEEMHQRFEVLRALVDLIRRDLTDVGELAAGLLAHLPPEPLLERFAWIDAAPWEQPRAGVGAADLAHEKHTSTPVGAGDDRGESASAIRHRVNLGRGSYVFFGVGEGVRVGTGVVAPGRGVGGDVTGTTSVRVGDGLGDGEGLGEGHGCEPSTFHE